MDTMEARKTLEQQTVTSIAELYFSSLNDRTTNKLHLIQESKNVAPEEIQTDARAWYAGFSACAKLLGANPSQLPVIESLLQTITRTFPDKARISA